MVIRKSGEGRRLPGYPSLFGWLAEIALVFGVALILGILAFWLQGLTSIDQFWFSVDLEFTSELDAHQLPDRLRAEFAQRGEALAEQAKVRTQTEGKEWQIAADSIRYLIVKENQRLKIYTDQYLDIRVPLLRLFIEKDAIRFFSRELGAGYLGALLLGAVLAWMIWHRPYMRRVEAEMREIRVARERLRQAREALETAAEVLAPLPWEASHQEEQAS